MTEKRNTPAPHFPHVRTRPRRHSRRDLRHLASPSLPLVEEAFGDIEDLDFDPMVDERTEKQQKSVDRARAQSHLILRRSLAELRKLQTRRTIQEQLQEMQLKTPQPEKKEAPPAAPDGLAGLEALMAMATISSPSNTANPG